MSEDVGVTESWGDPDPSRAARPAGGEWSYFPPPGQVAPLWEPPPPVPLRERIRPHAVTFGVTTLALVFLGAPLAFLWRAFAPAARVARTAGGPQLAAPESNQVFATDGWFVVVSALVGLLVGVVAWRGLRGRGPAAAFALATGGLLAAAIAAEVGEAMVIDAYVHRVCSQPDFQCFVYDGTLRLHALPAVVVLPVALLTAFAVMTFVFDRDERPAP